MDDVMETDFLVWRQENFNAINTFDGALSSAITQGHVRDGSYIWTCGNEEVAGINHESVGRTVNT